MNPGTLETMAGLRKQLTEELRGFMQLLFPPVCNICRTPVIGTESLCVECLSNLPPLGSPKCSLCSLPFLTNDGEDHLCGLCLKYPPPFDRVIAFGNYEGLLRETIHRYKYRGGVELDRPLTDLFVKECGDRLGALNADLILPVPLHANKLKERTYNQSLLIAVRLGKVLGLPVAKRLMRRVVPTQAQKGLHLAERKKNVKGAFEVADQIEGKHIVLVDDVVTTGATVAECAKVLKRAGATEVTVVALARAGKG